MSGQEGQILKQFDTFIRQSGTAVYDLLGKINPYEVHPEMFEMIFHKLKKSYIEQTAQVFSYLWDVERMRTMFFGTAADSGDSFLELIGE